MANRPNGRRVIAKVKLGSKNYYSRVKVGTAQILGLEIVTDIPKGKKDAIIRGAKGTKSYTVLFKTPQTVGGATVKSVDLPVPEGAKLRDMYKFLKAKTLTAGMVSPWGISYNWAQQGGGLTFPSLPDAGDLLDGIQDLFGSPLGQLLLEGVDLII